MEELQAQGLLLLDHRCVGAEGAKGSLGALTMDKGMGAGCGGEVSAITQRPSSKWRKQERPVAKGLWGPRGAGQEWVLKQ